MGAEYGQFQNATGWEEIFDKITGVGSSLFGTAQDIKDQITGNTNIDQGEFGDGLGTYEVTGGVDDPERKQGVSPLVYGAVAVVAIAAIYFFVTAAKKGKQSKPV